MFKRLLFEYIDCLPNKADSVIHIETDSIYFRTADSEDLSNNVDKYEGKYPVAFGDSLGNIKVEKVSKLTSYFLGKKFYCVDHVCKIKGIPCRTIDENGSYINLISREDYEDYFNGKDIIKTFATMSKSLFGSKICISAHNMTRIIKAA